MNTSTDEAAQSARDILASMLTLGHLLEVKPNQDIRTWHRAHLSLGEAFALLWQQDDQGGVVEPRNDPHTSARFLAAHLADLLLAGRLKLLWDGPEGQKKQLAFMVVNTQPVSVEATTALLQELYIRQENRLVNKKKQYAKSVQRFLAQSTSTTQQLSASLTGGNKDFVQKLETNTFDGLVQRGILTKEKQKKWTFFQETIYPTGDPTAEAFLVQDLRSLLKKEIAADVHLELLLKLIGPTTQVFTPQEEEAHPLAKQTREKFLHDGYATLTGVEPIGSAMVLMGTDTDKKDLRLFREGKDEIYVENSPFLADEEQSLRWKIDANEGVMS